MASTGGAKPWAEESYERGDPVFVDELRRVTDADLLGDLAREWYQDKRPGPRKLLVEYLSRPLNAFRHEVLVKRLFKQAEAAGDDELLGCFLVLFDRSLRRVRRKRTRYRSFTTANRGEAEQWLARRALKALAWGRAMPTSTIGAGTTTRMR